MGPRRGPGGMRRGSDRVSFWFSRDLEPSVLLWPSADGILTDSQHVARTG